MTTRAATKALLFLSFIINSLLFSPIAFSDFIDSKQDGDILYFLYASPNKIVRYDLSSEVFLSDITLAKTPSVFIPTAQHIYIGYNRELRRTDKEGSNDEFVRNFNIDIKQLATVNNLLLVLETNKNLSTLNSTDLSLISSSSSSINNPLISSNKNSSYYFNNGPRIYKVLAADPTENISNYANNYPSADKIFANPSESKIYTNAGIAHSAVDLKYSNSLAGAFDNITFVNDQPIVLRNKTLFMYDENSIDLGQYTLDHTPDIIAATNDYIFSFVTSESSVSTHKTALSDIQLPTAGTATDPTGLNYQPEFITTDYNNNIYLADIETLSIFNWQLDTQDYGPSLALLNTPDWMTFSEQHNRLYFGYSSGKITYFDLSLGKDAKEVHFTTLVKAVKGLLATGEFLFAVDASGARSRHYSLDQSGAIMNTVEWRYSSTEYIWNQYNDHLYQLVSNQIIGSEIQASDGYFGPMFSSNAQGLTLTSPLRINSDGTLLINGSGQIFNTSKLTINNTISNSIDDAVWTGKLLATVKSGTSYLQLWKENYELLSETEINDAASVRLFNLANQLIIFKQSSTGPVFINHDSSDLTDTDSDGINDLADNCALIANPTQNDFDQDNSGDECDLDNDNDLIPNSVEMLYGLDSFNADDALEDLDNDNFNNLIEFILETEMDNAESKPATITEFNHNLNDGFPTGFYNLDTADAWTIKESDDIKVLQSIPIINKNDSTSLFFSANFNAGTLSFKNKILGASYYYYNVEFYLDGELQSLHNSYYDWQAQALIVPEGAHTLEIRFSRNSSYSTNDIGYLELTNISFGPDKDEDGIIDSLDNCPNISNDSQYDADEDGLGNDCDDDPYGYDRDKDGIADSSDNCRDTYNPDQANIDNDYYGDACDDYDNRPVDSDQDGAPDYYDNCPLTSNSDQADLDWDGLGNSCDPDIDNDGLLNTIEDQYSFLNSYDSSDATLDYDNDSASNEYEISHGLNPLIADSYSKINLLEYYLLGDIDYFYVTDNQFARVSISTTETLGQFRVNFGNNAESLIERRENGIYILSYTENKDTNPLVFTDYPIFPSEMVAGEFITYTARIGRKGSGESEEVTTTLYLKDVGESTWQDKIYPSITIVENGIETTYLKGIGPKSRYGLELDSMNLDTLASPEAFSINDSEKSGGHFNFAFLFSFLLLITMAGHRKKH